MDCILAGGTYTRKEGTKEVTYTRGQPIKVSDQEFAAFPNKFSRIAVAQDSSREKQLESEVAALKTEVKTLTDENAELKKQLETTKGELELKTNPADEGAAKKK